MEQLVIYKKICHCNDGYITLLGFPALDDDDHYTIVGIGSAKSIDKSISLAKRSASRYISLDQDLFFLLDAGSSSWMLPDKDFIDMEQAFYEL